MQHAASVSFSVPVNQHSTVTNALIRAWNIKTLRITDY
jgi:hypothetical protein